MLTPDSLVRKVAAALAACPDLQGMWPQERQDAARVAIEALGLTEERSFVPLAGAQRQEVVRYVTRWKDV